MTKMGRFPEPCCHLCNAPPRPEKRTRNPIVTPRVIPTLMLMPVCTEDVQCVLHLSTYSIIPIQAYLSVYDLAPHASVQLDVTHHSSISSSCFTSISHSAILASIISRSSGQEARIEAQQNTEAQDCVMRI